MEVCCAAVGTDCRASEQLAASLSSPSRSHRGGRRACRLSLYRSGRAAPVASPSVVFGRRAASRSIARRRYREDPRFFFSLLVIPRVREEKDRVRTRFPSLSLSLSRTYPRPIVFIVLWISPPSSATARRAGRRQSPATGAHAHIRAEAHCSRREPRLFSNAWPRFLADFIPIPRNKLADDHGGICLLGIYSLPHSPLLLICCSYSTRTIFFSRFR